MDSLSDVLSPVALGVPLSPTPTRVHLPLALTCTRQGRCVYWRHPALHRPQLLAQTHRDEKVRMNAARGADRILRLLVEGGSLRSSFHEVSCCSIRPFLPSLRAHRHPPQRYLPRACRICANPTAVRNGLLTSPFGVITRWSGRTWQRVALEWYLSCPLIIRDLGVPPLQRHGAALLRMQRSRYAVMRMESISMGSGSSESQWLNRLTDL